MSSLLTESLEALYLRHVPLIRRAAAHACRGYAMNAEDVEDFTQDVLTKILENDYAVLSTFRQSCRIEAYLAMVVQNALKDHANKQWGKWRASSAALHQGTLAMKIDQLTSRDGRSLNEAFQTILSENPGLTTEAELHRINETLPPRTPRPREVPLDSELAAAPGDAGAAARAPFEPVSRERADSLLELGERKRRYKEALKAMDAALDSLDDDDKVIAGLMLKEMKVVDIAHALRREQKPLYRKVESIRKMLRKQLEASGITADYVMDLRDGEDD